MRFGRLGRENLLSPTIVLCDYFKQNSDKFENQYIYLIGVENLKKSLEEGGGVKCFGTGPDHKDNYTDGDFINEVDVKSKIPKAVVVSFDSHFRWVTVSRFVSSKVEIMLNQCVVELQTSIY